MTQARDPDGYLILHGKKVRDVEIMAEAILPLVTRAVERERTVLQDLATRCCLHQLAKWLRTRAAVWDPDDPPALVSLADDLERLDAAIRESHGAR